MNNAKVLFIFFKENYFKFRIRFINCDEKQWFVVLPIKFCISKKLKTKKSDEQTFITFTLL